MDIMDIVNILDVPLSNFLPITIQSLILSGTLKKSRDLAINPYKIIN